MGAELWLEMRKIFIIGRVTAPPHNRLPGLFLYLYKHMMHTESILKRHIRTRTTRSFGSQNWRWPTDHKDSLLFKTRHWFLLCYQFPKWICNSNRALQKHTAGNSCSISHFQTDRCYLISTSANSLLTDSTLVKGLFLGGGCCLMALREHWFD